MSLRTFIHGGFFTTLFTLPQAPRIFWKGLWSSLARDMTSTAPLGGLELARPDT